jgi:hypothetical protein
MPINEECPGQMGHLQIGKHGGTGIVNKKDNRNNLSSQQRSNLRVNLLAFFKTFGAQNLIQRFSNFEPLLQFWEPHVRRANISA